MASESENPKDMEELNRQRAQIRRIKRDVIKVCREGGPKILERLPLKEIIYKVPGIDRDIEKIEAEKPTKFISPFIDGVTYSKEYAEEPKERPKYKPPKDWSNFKGDFWEKYDYIKAQDPATWTPKDLIFFEEFERTPEYRAVYEVKPRPILSGG
jgi:hypothetical protein